MERYILTLSHAFFELHFVICTIQSRYAVNFFVLFSIVLLYGLSEELSDVKSNIFRRTTVKFALYECRFSRAVVRSIILHYYYRHPGIMNESVL